MGATIVVVTGRLDLSVGAVISLVNCLIAVHVELTPFSMVMWSVAGLFVGMAVGLVNAVFVVLLRLPSIIVTLATMFIVEGLTLLVLEQPGGSVPDTYSGLFTGEIIPPSSSNANFYIGSSIFGLVIHTPYALWHIHLCSR